MTSKQPSWEYSLAEAIKLIGSDGFKDALIQALERLADFDYSVIFVYRGDRKPIDLHDTFSVKRRSIYVGQYQEGPYLLDPFFQACRDNAATGLYRLKDLAPDRFYQSEYYRSYYKKTELAEEIGFVVALPNQAYVVISLMRIESKSAFSQREMKLLRLVEPVISALSERHWRNVHGELFTTATDGVPLPILLKAQVESAFHSFGTSLLTPRELEVVGLVLRGHSSDSVAQHLSIATGTVKTYRRNIYAKLGICSQAELFSMFLASCQKQP